MTDFYKSDTYQIVQAMKAAGNRPGVIAQWKDLVATWAQNVSGPDAEAIKAWLPLWQVRPFYTAAELAPIMPPLAAVLGLTKGSTRLPLTKSANRLANELKFARLPFHRVDGVEYFVVERTHRIEALIPHIEGFHHAQC